MKLYLYRGFDNERVPRDVTRVIVDDSVTVIKKKAFFECKHLVALIMGDNVKSIEAYAFDECRALRFIRLSKTMKSIGYAAFRLCRSLEALFLPSTIKSIEEAFGDCASLRLMILPHDIDLSCVDSRIIADTGIEEIAEASGVAYVRLDRRGVALETRLGRRRAGGCITEESSRRVNEWLIHHMDAAPFHKLCYNSNVTVKEINDYLTEHGTDAALQIDTVHGMTPLHILTMNPHVPADAIAALLTSNMEAVFCLDNSQRKTPLEYARDYNVDGLIAMISVLCNNRN